MPLSSACRRSAAGLLCALGAALAAAGPAAAGAPDQTWNCRASAAYVAIPARDRVEPVVANGSSKTATESPDRARCADDAGLPADTASDLGLRGPAAETTVNPDRGLAVDQSVTAKSSVADFAPGAQGLNLVVHGAHSEATATCTPSGSEPPSADPDAPESRTGSGAPRSGWSAPRPGPTDRQCVTEEPFSFTSSAALRAALAAFWERAYSAMKSSVAWRARWSGCWLCGDFMR